MGQVHTVREEEVNRLMLCLSELMNIRCPECGVVFQDFFGCSYLVCGRVVGDVANGGCGTNFCGICFEKQPCRAHDCSRGSAPSQSSFCSLDAVISNYVHPPGHGNILLCGLQGHLQTTDFTTHILLPRLYGLVDPLVLLVSAVFVVLLDRRGDSFHMCYDECHHTTVHHRLGCEYARRCWMAPLPSTVQVFLICFWVMTGCPVGTVETIMGLLYSLFWRSAGGSLLQWFLILGSLEEVSVAGVVVKCFGVSPPNLPHLSVVVYLLLSHSPSISFTDKLVR